MVGGISNISIPNLSYSMAGIGKMSIPVDSSTLVYSQFEHVSGVLAPEGTPGVSISKLNLLDVLIGQLNRIKTTTNAQPQVNPYKGVDALIEELSSKIRQAEAETNPYLPSAKPEPGKLLNLLS